MVCCRFPAPVGPRPLRGIFRRLLGGEFLILRQGCQIALESLQSLMNQLLLFPGFFLFVLQLFDGVLKADGPDLLLGNRFLFLAALLYLFRFTVFFLT